MLVRQLKLQVWGAAYVERSGTILKLDCAFICVKKKEKVGGCGCTVRVCLGGWRVIMIQVDGCNTWCVDTLLRARGI
jgi:hypothetical protein